MDFWQLLGLAEDKQKEKPSSSEGKFLSTKVILVLKAEIAETTLIIESLFSPYGAFFVELYFFSVCNLNSFC
jgi:hypothetical protein